MMMMMIIELISHAVLFCISSHLTRAWSQNDCNLADCCLVACAPTCDREYRLNGMDSSFGLKKYISYSKRNYYFFRFGTSFPGS